MLIKIYILTVNCGIVSNTSAIHYRIYLNNHVPKMLSIVKEINYNTL